MRFSKFTFRFFALFISGVIGIQSAQADIYQYVGDEDEIRLTNIESGENYKALVTEGNSEVPKSNPVTSSVRGKLPYTNEVKAAAKATSLDPALIHAVIATESQHNPRAVSPRGARGLMQLMPATARRFQLSEPYDPAKNVLAGAKYLRELNQQFKGNLSLMLAAYNAGPNAVLRYGMRIPPYAETQHYVPKVLRIYKSLSHQVY